jgi:hypothetical protein
MIDITYSLNLQLPGGPKFTFNDKVSVEAYDLLSVDVPPGTEWMTVHVEPDDLSNMVLTLINRTDKNGKDLYYKVNDGQKVALSGLNVVLGTGAHGLLKAAPQTLKFNTTGDQPAQVTILIGRKASVAASEPAPAQTPQAKTPQAQAPQTETA